METKEIKTMKELSEISLQITEPEYRAMPELSQSTLGTYERGGYDSLDTLFEKKESPSLTQGSMVDILITGSQEEFDKQFYVADFPTIGEKETLIANSLFEQFGNSCNSIALIPFADILAVVNAYEFQKNWKDETRVRVATERCSYYYQLKYNAGNRTIVPQKTYEEVMAMYDALKSNPTTARYFAANDPFSPIKRYYQLKFKANFQGVGYRGMMDLLIVDYDKKVIYPCDLKTSGHQEWNFENSFIQWSYSIQARLYWRLIRVNLNKDDFFKDFKLENFRFIVVNKKTLTPLVWEFPYTQYMGTLVDERGNEYRDPFEIGKELRAYLDYKPPVPKGVTQEGINEIKCLHPKEN